MKNKLLSCAICVALFGFARAAQAASPTDGLVEYFDTFTVQKPYDLNISDRFSATDVGGVLQYTCWVKSTDKPLYPTSGTNPRTEMRWNTNWTTTERMWEADVLVDSGTDGQTAIMQIKSNSGFEPIYITVNGGNLYNAYGSTALATNIIGKWFHMVCAYNPQTGIGRAWINGNLVVTRSDPHPLNTVWYFKNGTYHASSTSRTHFQNVRFWSHDQTGLVQAPSYRPVDGGYNNAQLITIYSPTAGASIRYTTDGSTPSATSGTLYTAPILLTANTTINAVAYKSGMTTSSVTFSVYQIFSTAPQVADPVFSSETGVYGGAQSVAMTSTTSGASIRYTTDGSLPTETHGTLYSGTPLNVGANTTLQAIAYKSGQVDSRVSYAFYMINGSQAATPVFNPNGGSFSSAQTVTITSSTSGAIIHYTTDGSTPTSSSGNVYTGPITISSSSTLKAIASASGFGDSTVASAVFTIGSGTGGPTSWEAESLTRTASGATATTDTDAAASGGARVTLNGDGVGDYLEFTLPNVPAGTYSVQMAYKTNANRGILNLKIDGTQVGGTLDQYASSSSYPTTTFGTVTFGSTANHALRLTVTGKNAASSSYTLSADEIMLVSTSAPPPNVIAEAESLSRTASGATATTDTDTAASGGARVTLNGDGVGDYVEFTLPGVSAGTYSVQMAYKTNNNRGILSLQVDGVQLGGSVDQYASSSSYPTATFGTLTFSSAGSHVVRLTVTGKNAASSSYTLSADKFTLVGQ